jgi:tetratricopeptide (TPR) repeat protein
MASPMLSLPPVRAALLLGCIAAAACKPDPSPASPAPSAERVVDAAPSIARRLALQKLEGKRPVDREIEARQKAVTGKAAENADAWVLLGRAWVKKARESSDPGFYLNANACAEIALEVAPGNRAALNLSALVLLNQHRFQDARDQAAQILAKAPHDRMALGTLSDALLELGRYAEATDAAQKMMDGKPNLPSYIRASYLEWLRGDAAAAIESAKAAIDAGRDPNDPEPRCWAMTQAAMIFWHRGDRAGADAGFAATLKECADYPPALAGRGRAALAGGEAARAAELLAASFAASPLAETAWLLGDARAAAGDAKGAAEAWAEVVRIGRAGDPRTLAQFYATKDRDREEAVRLAEAEKKVRDDLYTEDTLAWALHRVGRIAEARAAAEKGTALGTKDARLLYHAGAIRIAAGDKAAGEKLVREALSLCPGFDWSGAKEAEALLAR